MSALRMPLLKDEAAWRSPVADLLSLGPAPFASGQRVFCCPLVAGREGDWFDRGVWRCDVLHNAQLQSHGQ
jgi:hypothetical protein